MFCVDVEELGRFARAVTRALVGGAERVQHSTEYRGLKTTRAEDDDGKERDTFRAFPSLSAIDHHIFASRRVHRVSRAVSRAEEHLPNTLVAPATDTRATSALDDGPRAEEHLPARRPPPTVPARRPRTPSPPSSLPSLYE